MNLERNVRGVDRIAGEFLAALPDVAEALSRHDQIQESMTKHLAELLQGRRQVYLAELALKADIELLASENRDNWRDWRGRKEEIEAGAADLGLAVPQLGFRVIKDLPDGAA